MVVASCSYFASCVKGLEPILARELASPNIGAHDVREGRLGVSFEGPPEVGARAVLWGRSCLKVMELLGKEEDVHTADNLYEFARETVRWDELVAGQTETISVQAVIGASRAQEMGRGARPGDWHCSECGSLVFASKDACFKCGARKPFDDPNGLTHTHFSALTVKNAVVDVLRDTTGWRPSVDTQDADLPLFLHVHRGDASLYRVLSGSSSMHKRGYRADSAMHVAALRETLAAGLLLHADYDPSTHVLCDPMCGSGTIPIEAALLATNTAPGLLRAPPAFTRWPDDDGKRMWKHLTDEALDVRKPRAPLPILANDAHNGALVLAERAAAAAGVADLITFSNGHAAHYEPSEAPSLVITNPPWGERLEGGEEAWSELRTFLKAECAGAKAWVLSGNRELTQHLRMRAAKKMLIENAGTKLAFIGYDILAKRPPEGVPPTQEPLEEAQAASGGKVDVRGARGARHALAGDNLVIVDDERRSGDYGESHGVAASGPATPAPAPAAPASSATNMAVDGMSYKELQQACKARGLRAVGKAAELYERLLTSEGTADDGADALAPSAAAPAPGTKVRAPVQAELPVVDESSYTVADASDKKGDELEGFFADLYK